MLYRLQPEASIHSVLLRSRKQFRVDTGQSSLGIKVKYGTTGTLTVNVF